MKDKRMVYALAAVAAVAIAAIIYFSMSSNPSTTVTADSSLPQFEIKPTDHVRGRADAPITLVEYASMTCPHCADFTVNTMPKLAENYIDTGKVRLVFREYPLDGAARLASVLALCVPEDNYFSFIDLLFRNQAEWIQDFDKSGQINGADVLEGLTRMGRFAGMDRAKVEACTKDEQKLAIVDASAQEAQTRYGVNSTPTFFANGEIHRGEWPYPELDKYLSNKLSAK